MKTIFSILILLITTSIFGQVAIKKSSIDSGGGTASSGSLSIIHTVGEISVQESTSGNIHISEGFISPDIITVLGLENYTDLEGVTIFPNPTVDRINIRFSDFDSYDITVFDYSGRQLNYLQTDTTDHQTVDMSQYSNGIYFVLVKNTDKQQFKTYKIIKK